MCNFAPCVIPSHAAPGLAAPRIEHRRKITSNEKIIYAGISLGA